MLIALAADMPAMPAPIDDRAAGNHGCLLRLNRLFSRHTGQRNQCLPCARCRSIELRFQGSYTCLSQ